MSSTRNCIGTGFPPHMNAVQRSRENARRQRHRWVLTSGATIGITTDLIYRLRTPLQWLVPFGRLDQALVAAHIYIDNGVGTHVNQMNATV